MRTYTLPTLQIGKVAEGDRICCARCGYAIAVPGGPWKQAAIVREIPTDQLVDELETGEPAETICGSLSVPAADRCSTSKRLCQVNRF